MADPFLSITNGPSPKQVSITFLSYINVHTSIGSDECTCGRCGSCGQVQNVTLVHVCIYLVILRQPNIKKKMKGTRYKKHSL